MNPAPSVKNKIIRALGSIGVGHLFEYMADVVRKDGFKLLGFPFGILALPVTYVIGEVFKHMGIEASAHLGKEVFERLGKSPKELNHNFRKLYADAVLQTIKEGIPASYVKECKDTNSGSPLSNELESKLKELGKWFYDAFETTRPGDGNTGGSSLTTSELIQYLDEKQPSGCKNLYTGKFNQVGDEYKPDVFLEKHHFPSQFIEHFNKNFCPIVRILFIEGLKSKQYEKARIAYEQMMAEETYRSLNEIKKEIIQLQDTGQYANSRYAMIPGRELSITIENIKSPETIELLIHNGMDRYFDKIDKKLDDLLELAEDTNVKVSHIGVKTDRIEKGVTKNMVISYVLLAVVAVATGIYTYVYFSSNHFNFSLMVLDDHGQTVKSGLLYLNFKEGEHIMGKLGDDGIAIFEKIDNDRIGDTAEITLYKGLEEKYIIADSSKIAPVNINENRKIRLIEMSPASKKEIKTWIAAKENSGIASSATKLPCNLDGVDFKDEGSMTNHLTFHHSTSVLKFTGYLEIEGIYGELSISGNVMNVKNGNVSGTISLKNSCSRVAGVLVLKSNGANINIDFCKTE